MKILVCGGRDFTNETLLDAILNEYLPVVTRIVQGGAPGADTLAQRWAGRNSVPCTTHAANWKLHGHVAGPIRNREMFDSENPDLVIAFPGGSGTADMIAYAEFCGCEVRRISAYENTIPE